jgi:hypothetical protein
MDVTQRIAGAGAQTPGRASRAQAIPEKTERAYAQTKACPPIRVK